MKLDGGPASHEMSLRDHFAAQALIGVIGRSYQLVFSRAPDVIDQVVKDAYAIADAMLVERVKE